MPDPKEILTLRTLLKDFTCNLTLSHFLGQSSQKNHPVDRLICLQFVLCILTGWTRQCQFQLTEVDFVVHSRPAELLALGRGRILRSFLGKAQD